MAHFQRLRDNIERHLETVLPKGCRLDLAVSGGGDSMALLELCASLAPKWDWHLRVHIVRHGLRDDQADFNVVAKAAERHNVPLIVTRLTPPESLSSEGGLEAWARNARYEALVDAAVNADVWHLATAHTGDDQLETLLLRLVRGSGLEGAGMHAQRSLGRGISLIRPLLGCGRTELREYLNEIRAPFVNDPSNLDRSLSRNELRLGWTASWLDSLDNGARTTLFASLDRLRLDGSALSQLAEKVADEGQVTDEVAWYLHRDRVADLGREALVQVLRHGVRRVVPGHVLTAQAVAQALRPCSGHRPLPWQDGSVSIGLEGRFWVVRSLVAQEPPQPFKCSLALYDSVLWRGTLLSLKEAFHGANTSTCLHLRSAKGLMLLSASEAGTICRMGHQRPRSVMSLLSDLGVPKPWRAGHPVLCDDEGALWPIGGPRAARCGNTEEATVQLKVDALPWYLR